MQNMPSEPIGHNPILARAIRNFTGSEPNASGQYIAPLIEGVPYLAGTAIRAIITNYQARLSGLLVPEKYARQSAPIDNAYRYIPLSQIYNEVIPMEQIRQIINNYDRDSFVSACAGFAEMSHPSIHNKNIEDLYKLKLPLLHSRANKYLSDGDKFFGPQAALVLAKMAILEGSDLSGLPEMPIEELLILCIAIQDHFLNKENEENNPNLEIEIISNYWLHRNPHITAEFRRFEERWDSPDEVSVKLKEAFQSSQNFPVSAMLGVAAAIMQIELQSRLSLQLDLEDDDEMSQHIEMALELISADASHFKVLAKENSAERNFIWDFRDFQKYPIYRRADGRFTVLGTSFLLYRCLRWPLVYDSQDALSKADFSRLTSQVEKLAERNVISKFNDAFGSSWTGRIMASEEVESIYGGHGIQSADLVMEYEDSCLVIEVSAFRPTHQALSAESDFYYKGLLERVSGEANQALSTCVQILKRNDSQGDARKTITKVFPIVIATEGFIVNALTLMRIRELSAIPEKGYAKQVAPLEILNLDEVDTLLHLVSRFGFSIANLLIQKSSSNYWSDSVNNFLAAHYESELKIIQNEFEYKLESDEQNPEL